MMPATPPTVDTGALLRLADAAELEGRLGACQHPITLTGQRLLVDADSGQILSWLDPAGTHATVRCRSRRAAPVRRVRRCTGWTPTTSSRPGYAAASPPRRRSLPGPGCSLP